MRIACLQFAPQVGDVDNNLNRADAVLSKANPHDLDILVLPELAFSGYNFKSLQHISPYLEPTTAGITSLWARTTALKYKCVVTVGYPEKVDVSARWPASPEYYNSAITVNADGETIANYRKSFLYYTDETWALEGPDGFYDGEIEGLGNVAMGICKWPTKSFERMDLNPYKFEAPWSAWEFAYHVLHRQANLVILSMAWLTRENARAYSRTPKEPDMETLSYWLARLEPVIRAETEGEIIVVLANRCGTEDEAVYAGTSAVLGIEYGEVKVYGILGRGERELLVVDTDKRPQAKLVSQPNSTSMAKAPEKSMAASPRTDSTKSDTSAKSNSTKLSINTNGTTPSPQTPDAMDLDFSMMDEMITPLSPVEPSSPTQFFAPKGSRLENRTYRESLKSSSGQPQQDMDSKPDLPTYRPASPKSRNASRTRMLEHHEQPHGSFRAQTPMSRSASRNASRPPHSDESNSIPAAYVRPPSPKSRNASRTRHPQYQPPALASHDLAQEPQLASKMHRVNTPQSYGIVGTPHSASSVLDQRPQIYAEKGMSPRARSISPRPKSTLW